MRTGLTLSSSKIAIFIGAVFLSIGIYLPFFPLWLEARGFAADEIAILLSVPLVTRVLFAPFVTAFVGRLPQRRLAAVAYCAIALAVFAGLAFVDGFWPVSILLGVFGVFWSALIPLGDSFALSEVRLKGANYGTIRLWGSLTFILANLGAGHVLALVGFQGVHGLIASMLAVALFSAFFLPHYGLSAGERPKTGLALSGVLTVFLKNRGFMAMAASAGLIQASHALVYGFGTIDWIASGYSTTQIGAFWAVGVIAEIVLFTQAAPLFRRVRPHLLLLIGGGGAILRWSLHGTADGFFSILAIQCLHGLSFGATHLGMQSFVAAYVSEVETPAAQGGTMLINGVIMTALTFACGALYDGYGRDGFHAMAFVAAVGLVLLLAVRYPQRAADGG